MAVGSTWSKSGTDLDIPSISTTIPLPRTHRAVSLNSKQSNAPLSGAAGIAEATETAGGGLAWADQFREVYPPAGGSFLACSSA